jgi:hypothetical protein
MSDMTSVFAEITKSTPQDDGSLLVYGKATGSDLDLDEQRCDAAWLSTAMPEWFRTAGNVREQHDAKRAVGKAIEHEATTDGSHMIRARIVDPIAKAKVEAGILTGFSIGIKSPRIAKSADAKNGMIVGGQVVEVSLVDRPCLPTATLTMCKAASPGWEGAPADLDEDLGLVKCEELTIDGGEGGDGVAAKTTDVDHLEAPAPGQVCADCNEEGHLNCGPTGKTADGDDAPVVETVEQAQAVADALLEASKGAATEVHVHLDGKPLEVAEGIEKAEAAIVEVPVKPAFDVDQAKALVAAIAGKDGAEAAKAAGEILKATPADVPPVYSDEQSDVLNAQAAIAIIGKLIVSEASELVNNPAEAFDIQLLLEAIGALRCFIGREQQQSLGENDVCAPEVLQMAADADLEKTEAVEERPVEAEAVEPSDEATKAVEPEAIEPEVDATKTVEPEATKAAVFDEDAMLKALTGDLEKADSPLHKLFKSFVDAQATVLVEASTKSAAEAHAEVCARLEKVESMATPGGPSLRRTEVERTNARRDDLVRQAAHFKALAAGTHDQTLVKGYSATAAQIEAEIKGLAA